MNFESLTNEQKIDLQQDLTKYSNNVGGINSFLTLIEKIKDTKPNALLNKQATFKSDDIVITWQKSIYKDTLTNIFNAIKHEDKCGDILKSLNPKDYKNTMNMMKILKPITIKVDHKNDDLAGFEFSILDTSVMKNTKISLIFKVLFFYHVSFAKNILNFKA